MKKNISDYKNLYIKSARKYLDDLTYNLSNLQKNPESMDILNTMFLDAHSLKSESAVMKYPNTATLCNIIEEIFHLLKEGELAVSHNLITTLKQSFEYLLKSLQSIETKNKEINLSQSFRSLQYIVDVEHKQLRDSNY